MVGYVGTIVNHEVERPVRSSDVLETGAIRLITFDDCCSLPHFLRSELARTNIKAYHPGVREIVEPKSDQLTFLHSDFQNGERLEPEPRKLTAVFVKLRSALAGMPRRRKVGKLRERMNSRAQRTTSACCLAIYETFREFDAQDVAGGLRA